MRLLPVKLFFIKKTKKFKKVVQNMSKRWSKTMPVRTPNPVFRESFFKFWNSHTNQVLKTPISSGRVTQLISAPWKVITSRREGGGREGERSEDFYSERTNDRTLRAKITLYIHTCINKINVNNFIIPPDPWSTKNPARYSSKSSEIKQISKDSRWIRCPIK